MKLRCTNCGYKFVPKVRVPKKCPYCDSASLRREDTAGSLVREVPGK